MAQSRKKGRWRWWVGGVGVILLLVLLDYIAYPRWAPMGGRSGNRGENGLWIRYTWYFGQYQEADLARLAGRLRQGQVRYVYAHVRYLRANGELKFHFPASARRLTAGLHRVAPGVKVLAWIYVGGEGEHPPVNLADPTVRAKAVREADWLVRTCGFDGVQWDYEICHNGDPRLVPLLRDTRAALPPGSLLSVCTALWYPAPVLRWYGWSEDYFAQIAPECDQLAVMAYDSGIYLPRGYVALMRRQVVHATRAAARTNPHCRVLIGVPTYREGGPAHHARAENLRLALKGVREGLADPQTNLSTFAGIAPFAEYTTTVADWREVERDWIGR